MRIKNRICCKESLSVSSESDEKYKIRRSNSKRQRMAQHATSTNGKNQERGLPVTSTKNSGVLSWFLSFFGARKGRGPALKSKNGSEPELGRSCGKDKSEKGSLRKSVSDLLEEFNQPKKAMSKAKSGQTGEQRTTNNNAEATSNKATVIACQSQKEEESSSQENLLGAKSEVVSQSSSINNSENEESKPNKMEILAKKLDKINLQTAENIKRGIQMKETTLEQNADRTNKASEESLEKSAEEADKMSTSSSPENVEQPKKSVKALGALLQMKGPLPMPGMAGLGGPPPSLRKKSTLPRSENGEKCLEQEDDKDKKNTVPEDQFTSEKLKVNLRQRATKIKRPVSRKFRNSMQLTEMEMLED
ncbi:Oidioi.mRNA.OKI2018_I69.XSR.g15879.t1.cds [Oikopleura dioica]|uniref:Oidioi.mRNA.OKI2018_I69.XSR.g15879.t1.cds n=1 Tax=Oikopleura dioica TaxID=34765 RepID=A0ABN7SE90_OIKDI|nr:Oidioi.mRNA.OKI2018_I69.XSR.g15879.t1.cds [Oikopleura dioica]